MLQNVTFAIIAPSESRYRKIFELRTTAPRCLVEKHREYVTWSFPEKYQYYEISGNANLGVALESFVIIP